MALLLLIATQSAFADDKLARAAAWPGPLCKINGLISSGFAFAV